MGRAVRKEKGLQKIKVKKKDNMDGQHDLKNMSTMACSKNEILLMNEIDHKNTMAMKYSHMDETNIAWLCNGMRCARFLKIKRVLIGIEIVA
jgi:hypothetical protein